MKTADPPTDLIRPSEAARLLSCHVGTIHRWINRGKLPGYDRAGTRVMVSRADVLALVRPLEVTTGRKARPRTTGQARKGHREAMRQLRKAGLNV